MGICLPYVSKISAVEAALLHTHTVIMWIRLEILKQEITVSLQGKPINQHTVSNVK